MSEQQPESMNVHAILAVFVDQMASVAWQKLGLQPDALSGKIDRDLEQAKVAIDVCASLADHLAPQLDEEDKRKIQGLLRDLRFNYVDKMKESGA